MDKRVRFLNAPEAKFVDQKEEHLVIELPDGHGFDVGDILYGLPWHVCPTVALHQEAIVIDGNGDVVDRWPVVARNRRLQI
jgi:D-serine deaminase-like pyridoxal phosphate-dependent protein